MLLSEYGKFARSQDVAQLAQSIAATDTQISEAESELVAIVCVVSYHCVSHDIRAKCLIQQCKQQQKHKLSTFRFFSHIA